MLHSSFSFLTESSYIYKLNFMDCLKIVLYYYIDVMKIVMLDEDLTTAIKRICVFDGQIPSKDRAAGVD